MDKGQFLLYQTPDGNSQIEVKLQNDTVWLSLDQMAELFQRNKSTISRHIKNVLEDGELEEKEVVAFFATTTKHTEQQAFMQVSNQHFHILLLLLFGEVQQTCSNGLSYILCHSLVSKYVVNIFFTLSFCAYSWSRDILRFSFLR